VISPFTLVLAPMTQVPAATLERGAADGAIDVGEWLAGGGATGREE